jgi:hypothetical protein
MNAAHLFNRLRSCRSASVGPFFLSSCLLLAPASLVAHIDDASLTSDQIECITPDGRLTAISKIETAPADLRGSVPARDIIICNLQEGRTIFIIPLPKEGCDRFTFVNENPAACGEFEIAVSNAHLAAGNPGWIGVEGIVPFAHKRLFNLSMVGISARYMKVSFRVENTPGVTRVHDHRKHQLVAVIAEVETAVGLAER